LQDRDSGEWEEKGRGEDREREICTVEGVRMPHTSYRLEYIGDDNATIVEEKDTRMLGKDGGIKKRKIL